MASSVFVHVEIPYTNKNNWTPALLISSNDIGQHTIVGLSLISEPDVKLYVFLYHIPPM